jgi:hypothetical protein
MFARHRNDCNAIITSMIIKRFLNNRDHEKGLKYPKQMQIRVTMRSMDDATIIRLL